MPVLVERGQEGAVLVQMVVQMRAKSIPRPLLNCLQWTEANRRIRGAAFTVPVPLRAIYEDNTREVVITKAAQVGASEYAVNVALWVADTMQGGRGHSLYVLPAIAQSGDFVRARMDTAVEESPYLRERVKPLRGLFQGKIADNVGLKRIGQGWLYFRGSNAEAGLLSIDADIICYDEVDRLKEGTLAYGAKRLGSSALGWQRYVSTPTQPDTGIDALWARSDRRLWHVRCVHCGERQPMVFPDNLREDGMVICRNCGGELDRLGDGEWVPECPGGDIHGYHVSRFISPRANMVEIAKVGYGILAKDITDPVTCQQFWNQDLGLPYVPEDAAQVVVPAGWVRAAEAATHDAGPIEVVACDVARQGNDSTVVYSRRGRVLRLLWHVQGQDTMQTAGFLADYKGRHKLAHLVVDGVGIGAGVIDRLREQGIGVIEFQGGGGAEESGRYVNRNAEVWWRMRDAFGAGMDVDPNDRFRRDVSTRRYEIQSDRRIKLQSKDEMRALGIPSPDYGDAAAMTYVLDHHTGGDRLAASSDVDDDAPVAPSRMGFGNQAEDHQSLEFGRAPGYQPSRWGKLRGGHRR